LDDERVRIDAPGHLHPRTPSPRAIFRGYREEWIANPILWYQCLHEDDRTRWNTEAADLFLSGEPLNVETMGGRIWATSQLGAGSVFQFVVKFGLAATA